MFEEMQVTFVRAVWIRCVFEVPLYEGACITVSYERIDQ